MRRLPTLLLILTIATGAGSAPLLADEKAADKRSKIDTMAAETFEQLLADNAGARALQGKAYGHAVFSNVKVSLIITGGGGSGVAVAGGKRTYMKMGTAGLNIGLGGQKYQVVFLFQGKAAFDNFVDKGWQADASANAVAGKAGANAEATFRDGMAVYQLTDAGLMLQADIAGTKYWKAKKLN